MSAQCDALSSLANWATILASLIAIVTVVAGYKQFVETERARRLDILEARVVDAFLVMAPIMSIPANFLTGNQYRELIAELDHRRVLARLLKYWRVQAGHKRDNPVIKDCWIKLAVDVRVLRKATEVALTKQGIDLSSYAGQSMEALYEKHREASGGFSSVPVYVESGRELAERCDELESILADFSPEHMELVRIAAEKRGIT